jgi:hypothetical protein
MKQGKRVTISHPYEDFDNFGKGLAVSVVVIFAWLYQKIE